LAYKSGRTNIRKYENKHELADDEQRDLITGRNPVLEALKSERPLNKIYVQKPASDGPLRMIDALARGRGVPVSYVEKAWLDRLAGGAHQGTAALAAVKEYCGIQDILDYAAEIAQKPLLVVANGIHDPNNLGAIIRSSEAAGAHGVVTPKRNAAGLTGAVAKASAGAVEHMRIARVSNITAALQDLKKQGLWIIGADAGGGTLYTDCDYTSASAIVIGGESGGLGRLVGETCDYIVKLPMFGKVSSLNASAAAAVILYEVLRQRLAVNGR